MSYRKARTQASTVIEVLVAVFILAIGVSAVYVNLIQQSHNAHASVTRLQARMLAQQKVEELRTAPLASLRQWTPPDKPYVFPNNLRFQYKAALQPADGGALNILVTVGWNPNDDGSFPAGDSVQARGVHAP